jgi:AcrR family transcriptional regulator
MNAKTLPLKPAESTRAKIVTAALRVFATRGFEAASLKEITTASETNVAAIHYHFGSKEALIREVLQTVADPVNQMRMEMLARPPARPGQVLEHVVEALLAPPIRLSADATGDGRLLARLILQARALPSEFTNSALFQQYDSTALHFVQALMDAEPGLDRQEAFWRYAFAIGAMHYIVSDSDAANHRLNRLSGGLCDTDDPEAIVRQLVAFVVAGMRARAPARPDAIPFAT